MVVTVCIVSAGCTFGVKTCETSADCVSGQCDQGVCLFRDDGGSGGGGGTGGGGGAAADCPGSCSAWQSCQPGNGGTCRDVSVRIESPLSGAIYNEGASARVVARVTDWDGGSFSGGTIPASATPGVVAPSQLTRSDAGLFVGDFRLPAGGGTHTLTAGWSAASASVDVVTQVCSVSCAAWEECLPNATGGTCVDLGLTLAWVTPDAGQQFGPRDFASVSLGLTASRADGGAFSGDIPFSLMGGAAGFLTRSGTEWRGTVDAGTASGTRTVVAGWAGGPTASRAFEVVLMPPTVTLQPQAAAMRNADDTDLDGTPRWKKSDQALVQVEADRQLVAIQSADFANSGVTVSAACTRACGLGKFCSCFAVDLARQPLMTGVGSIFGTVQIGLLRATDLLGNVNSAIAPQNLEVTRLKWRREVSLTATAVPTGVAVAPNGLVVVGASTGATGVLKAYMPDGGLAWTNTYVSEAITAGPVLGTQGVYFGVTNPTAMTASIRRVGVMDGIGAQNFCGNLTAQTFSGDLALASPGAAEVVVAVRSDVVLAPTTASCIPAAIVPSPGTPGAANRPSVVAAGTEAFVGMGQRAPIWKFTNADSTPVAAGNKSTTTLFPSNLFLVGSNLVGGGGPTVGGAFAFLSTGVLTGSTVNATPGSDPGGAATVGGTSSAPVVFYGDSAGSQRRVALDPVVPAFGAASAGVLGTMSLADRAAVVGRGGRLYVVGSDGVLRVLNAASLAEEWRWDSAFPTTAISQLNLDINRDTAIACATAGPSGVLYVAASTSAVTRLYAVLVDSAGLDGNAPWPRHQHDPANTGNPATSLAPWTCP